ncbi:DUF3043 domain-containing protein [Luedemannella helvata]|uniref:DUF3043 domain-containing protein n=1 Tax=Luedemannella helvata TaxID=349315 RepID=A0ABN2K1F0_9ACTN
MPTLFRRKSNDLVANAEVASAPEVHEAAEADEGSLGDAKPRSYTPGKGRATPKRKDAGRRVAEAPPKNRREAYRRLREKDRAERAENRAAMLAGREDKLLPRDRGPERRLVRDIVDSRRNIGTMFFVGALIVIIGSMKSMPVPVQVAANLFWVFLALAVIVDSFLLCRKVRRLMKERFPKTTTRMGGHYFYAIMRSITFRRIRMPAPQVKIGDKI